MDMHSFVGKHFDQAHISTTLNNTEVSTVQQLSPHEHNEFMSQ